MQNRIKRKPALCLFTTKTEAASAVLATLLRTKNVLVVRRAAANMQTVYST